MSKKISEMTPTGVAPATSELAIAYSGDNYKITPQNFVDSVSTGTSGPAMWINGRNMTRTTSDIVLGPGVTADNYRYPGTQPPAVIGIGVRAALLSNSGNTSKTIMILPSNPSLYNDTNNSLGHLTSIGDITLTNGNWGLTDGGPNVQNGWLILLEGKKIELDGIFLWAWTM